MPTPRYFTGFVDVTPHARYAVSFLRNTWRVNKLYECGASKEVAVCTTEESARAAARLLGGGV